MGTGLLLPGRAARQATESDRQRKMTQVTSKMAGTYMSNTKIVWVCSYTFMQVNSLYVPREHQFFGEIELSAPFCTSCSLSDHI